ncbi:NAD(P)-binding protein [Xylaria arbuscula]|nr:NAD(P)-binding protein [Xylaria arbuscula]
MNIGGCAFVIGGGGGISRAASIAFAKEGARGLLVADIDLEAATKTASDSKASATNPDFRAEAIQLDVTLPDAVQKATAYMVETFGRIDYCVNGAGVTGKGFAHISDTSFDQFQSVLADAIIFLSSARSSWVNGSSMVVDGAMSIRP